ncbi:hypothetical protein A0J61_03376 [Choanephora cucurbitarum]|uniref:Uncharacterized protein n=1 Tax=Choanephora cucurbitarum TaxID=101091 RepID=A0A1C7NMT7_9FUNG|nr:hypothetical protein A0J61_03376 [Choanephora cucurbitarum]
MSTLISAYDDLEGIEDEVSAEDWEIIFLCNKTTPAGLFQYFYFASEDKPLDGFLEQNKTTLNAFRDMKTSNKKALIDQMSLKMLENYERLTDNEKNILKLSLSYIVDLSGDSTNKCKKDMFDGLDFIHLEKSKLPRQRRHESNEYQIL